MAEASIDKLILEILLKDNNFVKKLNNMTKAVENYKKAVGDSKDFEKIANILNGVSPTSTRGGSTSGGGSNKTSKNLNIFATLGKWNYMINMARYYGRSLANIVQLSMDYVETQNLWQVANRNNLEMAEQFIQKMNKAYGVSEATLMNYQAIFKNMLSALGDLSDEISSGLSMQLTQMALDFSSLYNVTIPSAMQKFQAVLSGQVRPIRSVSGYDITENTIFDLYAGAGGEKTMRQLSQIEKRLLRIVAVFDQMGATGATGDMAKTIESASNQARIMSEQFQEAMTWAGQMVLTWLNNKEVLQYINGLLITMKEVLKSMAYTFGYEEQDFLGGLVTATEEASESIDEIQGKLLSFDRFEALNSQDSNILGIDSTVLKLLEGINFEMNDFTMKAQELAQSWLEIIGYTYNEQTGLWETEKTFGSLLETFEIYSGYLKEIWTLIFDGIIKPIGKLTVDILPSLNNILASALSIIIKIADAILPIVADIVNVIAPFLTELLPVVATIVDSLMPLIDVVMELVTALRPLITSLLQVITQIVINVVKILQPALKWFVDTFAPVFSFIVGLLEVAFKWLSEHKTLLLFLINPIMGIVSALYTYGEQIKAFFVGVWQVIANGFASIINGIANGFIGFVNFLIDGLNLLLRPIDKIAGIFGGNIEIGHWNASVNWQPYPAYATGGFPEDGLFFANSGEMVGQFSNGRTAVANNDQIVTGITQGVYSAMMAYNAQTRGQGGAGDVYLDGTKVGRVVAKGSHSEMVRVGLIKANS